MSRALPATEPQNYGLRHYLVWGGTGRRGLAEAPCLQRQELLASWYCHATPGKAKIAQPNAGPRGQ
jgi:hypothetical protein